MRGPRKGQITAFSDAFARADGALGNGWTGATWAIASGAAVNTPTAGGELLTNGDMETGDPPNNWLSYNSATLDGVADERTGGAGAQSLSVVNGAASPGRAYQSISGQANKWLLISGWGKVVTDSRAQLVLANNVGAMVAAKYVTGGWEQMRMAALMLTNGSLYVQNFTSTIGHESRYDDLSILPLTSLLATRSYGAADVKCGIELTLPAGGLPAGVVTNLDNPANPQNYVLAYHDKTYAYLVKVVAGTATQLIKLAAAYAAGSAAEIWKSGTTYQLRYGGTQVGADQTIDEATINNNLYHGIFSTDPGNSLDNFSLDPWNGT
jgi:hypothetical protein